jgi:hypothetical protein
VYGKAQLTAFSASMGFMMVTAHAAGLSVHEAAAALANLSQVSGNHGIRRMSMELDNLMRSLLSIDDVSKRSSQQLKAMGIDDAASFQNINMRAADLGMTFDKLHYSSLDFMGKLKYLAQLSGFTANQYNTSREAMIAKQAELIASTKGEAAAQTWLNMQNNEGAARFMKLVGGAAAFIPALTLLTSNGAEYTKILGQMNSKTDIVKNAFDNMRQTANQQWKMAEIGVQNLLVVIGLQLLPILQNIYHWVYEVTNGIIRWLQNTGNMETFKYALLGIAIIVSSILLPTMIKLALAFVANPVGIAMMAIVAAGILLGKVLQSQPEIIKAVQAAFQSLMGIVGHVAGVFQNLTSLIGGQTKSAADTAAEHTLRMRLSVVDNTLRMQQEAEKHALALDESVRRTFSKIKSGAEAEAYGMRLRVADLMLLMRRQSVAEVSEQRQKVVANLKAMAAESKPALNPMQQAFASLGEAVKSLMPVIQMLATFLGNLLVGAIRLLVPILGLTMTILAGLVTVAGHVIANLANLAMWVRNNEAAFTAIKAVLITVGVVMGVNMVEDLVVLAGKLLFLIPILWGQAAAWWATASAAIVAELPIYLLIAAIALLAFGIMELVQHWTQVKAFFGNIASAVGAFFSWLGSHVHGALDAVGGFFQAAFGKIGALIHWFTTLTPQKIAHMVGFAIGYLIGMQVRAIITVAKLVWGVLQWIGHLAQEAPGFILRMVIAFLLWFDHMRVEGQKKFLVFVTQALLTIAKLIREAPAFILTMAVRIIAFLLNLKTQAWQKIKDMAHAIWTELQKLPGQAIQAAKDFIAGLINGIKNGVGAVVSAVKNLASGLIQGFTSALGIHSPSTVMFRHGINLIQGLINGFQSVNLGGAWLQMMQTLTAPTIGAPALAGEGHAVGVGVPHGGPGGLRQINGRGGAGTVTYNITVNTASAHDPKTLAQAIRTEMDNRERDNYAKGRRPGGFQGFRAGI